MLVKAMGPRMGNNVINLPLRGTPKVLMSFVDASADYDTMRDRSAGVLGTHYQVPVGKKFVVLSVSGASTTGASGFWASCGYGDTAVTSQAVAPTNGVGIDQLSFAFGGANANAQGNEMSTYFEVPAGKYLCCKATGTAAYVQVFGYEVSV